jgi:hypothetical protein
MLLRVIAMLIMLERQNFARSASRARSNTAAFGGSKKTLKFLLANNLPRHIVALFWGEQPPFMPFGCGGRYFFPAPSLESSLSWPACRRYI